ncbi:MAG TPA: hypothetical protein VGL15_06755 [Vicinamibacteria bacterium]|jgi:hypothetical protein
MLVHKHSVTFTEPAGTAYSIRTYGKQRRDGTWIGWIEFHPRDGSGKVVRTGRETTQPNRKALAYWADGLEPLYFEGAFERARRARAGVTSGRTRGSAAS